MPAPPSRESWVWHLAAKTMEHCQALGAYLDDLEVVVVPLKGAALVSISDWQFRRRGVPLLVASAAIPGADKSIAQEIRRAIEAEAKRVGYTEPAGD